jgi:CheY-like chemotaxis protein
MDPLPKEGLQEFGREQELAQAKEWFEERLKTALVALYDPSTLRASQLITMLNAGRRGDPITLLRDTLLEAIEALKPDANTPRGSHTWRAYSILRRRYTEQVPQKSVAKDMGLSVRQLQREEKMSRQLLTDFLWTRFNLDARATELVQNAPAGGEAHAGEQSAPQPAREQELEWLRASVTTQEVDLTALVQDVLLTAEQMLRKNEVTCRMEAPDGGVTAALPGAILRQALLNVLAVLSKNFPGSGITIMAENEPERMTVCLECLPGAAPALDGARLLVQYECAVSLMQVCQGSIEVNTSGNSAVTRITIPLQRRTPVLVIDDNEDALQLMERYLAGTPYRFAGVRDTRNAVAMAEKIRPGAIVLDVMMPEKDGWNLLGQFRQHPAIKDIPVIVCTILAQRDLALALGADDFLRKPVSRQILLAALGCLLASQSKASG